MKWSLSTGWTCAGFLAAAILTPSANATPIVSIDLDPTTPGIQASATVALGGIVSGEIVVQAVTSAEPLNGFELDLAYASAFISVASLQLGSFLVPPTSVFQSVFGPPELEIAAVTLGPGAAFGDGVLAVVAWSGTAPGMSSLDLNDVLLSQPFGVPIAGVTLQGAVLTVVPEPSTLLLLTLGLVALGARARPRDPRRRAS